MNETNFWLLRNFPSGKLRLLIAVPEQILTKYILGGRVSRSLKPKMELSMSLRTSAEFNLNQPIRILGSDPQYEDSLHRDSPLAATTSTTATGAVANELFNQPENQATSSTLETEAVVQLGEDSASCCQKAGNCFRGFFSKKTKTD